MFSHLRRRVRHFTPGHVCRTAAVRRRHARRHLLQSGAQAVKGGRGQRPYGALQLHAVGDDVGGARACVEAAGRWRKVQEMVDGAAVLHSQ